MSGSTLLRPFPALGRLSGANKIAATRRLVGLIAISLIFLSGTAKSTPIARAQAIRTTPIRIINTNAGQTITAHAERYEEKVYIDGLVHRPPSPGIGAHVHVWGVDKNNRSVFFKTTDVLITGSPSLIHTEPYVVSISPFIFNKAFVIYVTFHSQGDDESRKID